MVQRPNIEWELHERERFDKEYSLDLGDVVLYAGCMQELEGRYKTPEERRARVNDVYTLIVLSKPRGEELTLARYEPKHCRIDVRGDNSQIVKYGHWATDAAGLPQKIKIGIIGLISEVEDMQRSG